MLYTILINLICQKHYDMNGIDIHDELKISVPDNVNFLKSEWLFKEYLNATNP